jgi:hypothetical protein
MRRLLALSLLISTLAYCCAAGLTAPAALAAGSTSTAATTTPATTTPATTTPGFGLSNAQQNAVAPNTNNVAPATTSSGSGGLSGADAFIIGIVGVAVLFGIAFFVWRDARGHAARIGHGGAASESMFGKRAHAGSKAPPKARKLTAAERKRRKRGRAR